MKLLWNNENIEPNIEIQDIIMHDHAGGVADSMEIYIPDPEQAWAKWKPQKGDTIEAVVDGYSTGKMFLDGWKVKGHSFIAAAISMPKKGKSKDFRAWSGATLIEIFGDIASACGLGVESYDIHNYNYDRVDKNGVENLAFLKYLSDREGYSLKCHNGKAVIFGEKAFESKSAVKTISRDQLIGDCHFGSEAVELYSKGIMKYYDSGGSLIEYTYEVPGIYGGVLRLDEHAASIGEAERFVKSALRRTNKWESKGFFSIQLDTTISATVNVDIAGLGAADGKWYLTRVDHSLLHGYTHCWCRKGIEGDY